MLRLRHPLTTYVYMDGRAGYFPLLPRWEGRADHQRAYHTGLRQARRVRGGCGQ